MVTTDTIEGVINGTISYHYDVCSDVLYLRLLADMKTPAIGEETDKGDIELHEENTGRLIGITIISWWKNHGKGALPDSISDIQKRIEPLAKNIAA